MPSPAGPDRYVLAAVAIGGALGSLARYAVDVAAPAPEDGFPLGTFLVNVVGCLLLGAVAGWVYDRRRHRLAAPFLVVGVLGGFTTFSAYTVATVDLALRGEVGLAAGYLLGTLAAALVAVEAGLLLTRAVRHRTDRARVRA